MEKINRHDICSSCENKCIYVNRTKKLCQNCNYRRLHDGKTPFQVNMEKGKLKTNIPTVKHTKASKPNSSSLQLQQLKKDISSKAHEEGRYYCWGCGITSQHLDRSHIISVAKRKDLECDEENINLFCRDCHMDWESGNIQKQLTLLTFTQDLEYIKVKDSVIFNRLLNKLEDYHPTHPLLRKYRP